MTGGIYPFYNNGTLGVITSVTVKQELSPERLLELRYTNYSKLLKDYFAQHTKDLKGRTFILDENFIREDGNGNIDPTGLRISGYMPLDGAITTALPPHDIHRICSLVEESAPVLPLIAKHQVRFHERYLGGVGMNMFEPKHTVYGFHFPDETTVSPEDVGVDTGFFRRVRESHPVDSISVIVDTKKAPAPQNVPEHKEIMERLDAIAGCTHDALTSRMHEIESEFSRLVSESVERYF